MPLKTKELRTAYMRKWRKNHPERVKIHNEQARIYQAGRKFYKYDITEDEYNDMFMAQNGKCLICGKHQSEIKTALHIDHCHETGKVRGLLCHRCNIGIGLLEDDIENLRCAILYLNKKD